MQPQCVKRAQAEARGPLPLVIAGVRCFPLLHFWVGLHRLTDLDQRRKVIAYVVLWDAVDHTGGEPTQA